MNNEENILKQAGLSEEQAIVYQALLDKGPQKASPLSTWTGIKRGLIYKVLEQLENMNLIEKKGGAGTVAVFYPNHPSLLMDKIERDKKNLELSKEIVQAGLGSFASKYNLITGKPNVRFFEGKEGISEVTNDTLSSKTEIYAYIDSEAVESLYPDLNKEYVGKRMKQKIHKKIISPDSEFERGLAKDSDNEFTETRVLGADFRFATVMQIYDNKISYITLSKDKQIGVIIEDPDIYKTHKAIFEHEWKTAEKI
ncbi:MAG: helix-turn-helix domain-containing protein [Minisyncoccia bacterium]